MVAEDELTTAARILAALPLAAREMLWQQAFESHYQDSLLTALATTPAPAPAFVHTQLVTCIDTRSEGLRRHLESRGATRPSASPGSSQSQSASPVCSAVNRPTCARC